MLSNKKHNYLTKVFKILSNSNRLRIVELLLDQQNQTLTVNEISEQLAIEQSLLSSHLRKMRDANIVKARQDSTNMYYSIKDQNIIKHLK